MKKSQEDIKELIKNKQEESKKQIQQISDLKNVEKEAAKAKETIAKLPVAAAKKD